MAKFIFVSGVAIYFVFYSLMFLVQWLLAIV